MEPLKDIMHYFFQKCDFFVIFGHQKVEPRPGSGSLSLTIGRGVTERGGGGWGALWSSTEISGNRFDMADIISQLAFLLVSTRFTVDSSCPVIIY
jgi:hypothetical protein